jgi:hypothetical protein
MESNRQKIVKLFGVCLLCLALASGPSLFSPSMDRRNIMTKNVGTIDRAIRALLAVVVAVLYFTNVISGTLAIILGVLAIVFLATSFLSFCPLYLPFNLSTRKDS